MATQRIAEDLVSPVKRFAGPGSGLSDRSNAVHLPYRPVNYSGLRLATQVHCNLFGVVYVLDEPSAGLHPADTEALIAGPW